MVCGRPSSVQVQNFSSTFTTLYQFKNCFFLLDAEISLEEAADVLDMVLSSENGSQLRTRTAFEILYEELSHPPIYTMSQKLDELLDGGIKLAKLTEISGIAGVGKTQMR